MIGALATPLRLATRKGERLGAFLEQRVRSTQYRSQQGMISLVHEDFRELSKFMKQLRVCCAARASRAGAAPLAPEIQASDRIVLAAADGTDSDGCASPATSRS